MALRSQAECADVAMSVFLEHGPYLAAADELEIERRITLGADVADLSLRTCLCGLRLAGADDLHSHLQQQLVRVLRRAEL